VPEDATKASYSWVRDQFKACVLAVGYGMGHDALADRIGQPTVKARSLLQLHAEAYPQFWRWSNAAVDFAMSHGYLYTVFGWRVLTGPEVNPRSMRNFPAQANGAEMLRLACCLATERGIEVCAPVHDAVLICTPLDQLESDLLVMQEAMREASSVVLDGFELATEAKPIRYPDRYMDSRGKRMWDTVMKLLEGPIYDSEETTEERTKDRDLSLEIPIPVFGNPNTGSLDSPTEDLV
jgi:DNA polymerase I